MNINMKTFRLTPQPKWMSWQSGIEANSRVSSLAAILHIAQDASSAGRSRPFNRGLEGVTGFSKSTGSRMSRTPCPGRIDGQDFWFR